VTGTDYDRKVAMRPFAALVCLVLATACSDSPTGPTIPLNTEFTLTPGGSALIEGASTTVRFNRVTGDSRCPADAICIQGGDAIVSVTATSSGGARDHELHTGTMAPVRHDDLTIALVQLAPYPFSSGPIQPNDYRATLRVTR
jgi:hypothetical protein